MMRKLLVSVSALVFSITVPMLAQSTAGPLTAHDLVQMAIERNQNLLAARQGIPEAQGLLRQAGVRLTPTLEIGVTNGNALRSPGEQDYSATYFYPFETAGKRGKRIRTAEFDVPLAKAQLADQIRQLAFKVKMRVAEAYAAERRQDTIKHLLDITQHSYRLTAARVRQGDAAPLDQQLLAAEVGRVEAQEATQTGRVESALLQIRTLVGMDPDEPLHLADDPPAGVHESLAELEQRARKVRPDLQVARLLEQQANAQIKLQRAEGRPNITASAGYAHRSTQFNDEYGFNGSGALTPLRDQDNVLSVGLSIPLFTEKRNRGNIEAAVSRSSAARLHREYLEKTIPIEVDAAYKRYVAAQRALDLFRKGVVQQSEQNLKVIRQSYTLGQLRLLDVLTEQRRVLDTELAYIDAQTEAAQAEAELSRAVGVDLP